MKLPQFCITRPVFATVLSLILIVIGLIGYSGLKTRFFPRFEPAKIFVTTVYPGASAKLVEGTVTTPLEKSVSGIEGIDDIASTSTQGSSNIVIDLKSDANINEIINNIRNQVALTAATLPSTVQSPVVRMGHANMDLMDVAFSIQGDSLHALRDYLDRYVVDQLAQIPGVSTITVMGASKYAMQITLHPNKMVTRNVSLNDITQAIKNSNIELPAGYIQTATMNFPITAKTALNSVDGFNNIVVKNIQGNLIYLKDVADIKLGSDGEMKTLIHVNGKPAILLSIYNSDDGNPIHVSQSIKKVLRNIGAQLPSNMHYNVTFDQSTFMKASISEVYKSIAIAILFVGMIIFITLGEFRAALIPIVTIPVCVFATMGCMYFLGFSINIITLLAIVLCIGLVVDDAIVVLENCYRHMERGTDKLNAALQGSREIATPVIAMTLTLAAVYAPIGLIRGMVAHIFSSFAFTLAAAVIISGFVALTLSPMMCSKLLSTGHKKNKLNSAVENFFHQLTTRYQTLLEIILRNRIKIILFTVLLIFSGYFLLASLPRVFLPNEDMGFVVTSLHSATNTNNTFSESQLNTLHTILSQNKNIKTNVSVSFEQTGTDNQNMIFTTLHDYQNRDETAKQIADSINKKIADVPGLSAFSFPPSFGGSIHSQVAFYIMSPSSYHYLYDVGQMLSKKLSTYPGLKNVTSTVQFDNQQYNLTVNRALADQLQIPISNIDNTISTMIGGDTVSTFDLNGETYNVTMQAPQQYFSNSQNIAQLSVQNNMGQYVPLNNLIQTTEEPMQTDLLHYNRLRAAEIRALLVPGYSIGDAVTHLQKILPTLLPSSVKYAFKGEAARIADSSHSMLMIFVLALVFIYLVLSAQFESFRDPFIILLSVPLSIIGALFSLKLIDGSINLYTVIALVTLVGLIAKHGILITQFANTLRETGREKKDALIAAASIRLRPILMTTAAMVFGALPLLMASGASEISREQVGAVIVGGLIFGTFFSLILVPVAYSIFSKR